MKIAILSLYSRFGNSTGDMVQAQKTADALKYIGQDVLRCYLNPADGIIFDACGNRLGSWEFVMNDMDIIHAMVPFRFIKALPKVKAKFVCYTVFWKSWACLKVAVRNKGRLDMSDVKDIVKVLCAKFGLKACRLYNGYDLLLANSEDEARKVAEFCKIKESARIETVPNAIDELSFEKNKIVRLDILPKDDYIVVPAFFAPRKNQMGLIRALRDVDLNIVFLGDGSMLENCKRRASRSMTFLGKVEHGSELFWSALAHARVLCLPSNCETPGIAGLEGASVGARPVVPYEGGTTEYYGWDAEYHDPTSDVSLKNAVLRAWNRGRLSCAEAEKYRRATWNHVARVLVEKYKALCRYE